jgi:hypothetical protein
MNKRINLFNKKRQSIYYSPQVAKFTKYGFAITGSLLVIFIALVAFSYKQSQDLLALQLEKQKTAQYLYTQKEIEGQMVYFALKEKQLKTYLLDDAQFLPYYSLMSNLIANSNSSPVINKIIIDKTKAIDLELNFPTYDAAVNFLKYAETNNFLVNFETLTLSNLSISTSSLGRVSYQLQMIGKFKKL